LEEIVKTQLIAKARKLYNNISPSGNRESLEQCFTRHENKILFWFNHEHDHSTKILIHELEEV
jgi:hypothetical protein